MTDAREIIARALDPTIYDELPPHENYQGARSIGRDGNKLTAKQYNMLRDLRNQDRKPASPADETTLRRLTDRHLAGRYGARGGMLYSITRNGLTTLAEIEGSHGEGSERQA